MTDYELTMFNNLNTLTEINKWFGIKQDRPDLEAFIAVIKKRIDLSADFEFSNDYTLFKRVLPFNTVLYEHKVPFDFMPQINDIHDNGIRDMIRKHPHMNCWKDKKYEKYK